MYTLGIDIGSATTKAVVLGDGSSVVAQAVIPVGTGTDGPARILADVLQKAAVGRGDIAKIVVTGYGRITFREADKTISEITCHARGVHHAHSKARTIIDIGGQDIKVIRVTPEGYVGNFVMNDKCAAGTGRFLEVMSRVLEVDIGEMGALSEQCRKTVPISSICTVFAESEVISHLSRGEAIPDVIAGIHESVAKRVAGLVSRIGPAPDIVITGGVAKNTGIVKALRKVLSTDILVAPSAQLTGALGAAILAREETENKQGRR